jgi:methyl-accepting chemotaxis protein
LATGSVKVAERSGKLLGELVPAIRKTTDLVQEVAAASSEQSTGVRQINQAMSRVDDVTQRNASAAEELASTSEEMASQAEGLQQLMEFFKIDRDEFSHARSRAHAPLQQHPAVNGKYNGKASTMSWTRNPSRSNGTAPVAHSFASSVSDDDDHDFKRF